VPYYWPKFSLDDRKITWNMDCQTMNRLIRACGHFGVVVCVGEDVFMCNEISASEIKHSHPPGVLLSEDDASYVISNRDGIVMLMKHGIIETLEK